MLKRHSIVNMKVTLSLLISITVTSLAGWRAFGQPASDDPQPAIHLDTHPISVVTAANNAKRTFTVRDSIELTRFSDPNAKDWSAARIKYSPDSKYVIAVTTRGLVDTNQVESTLWLFDMSQVRAYVRATGSMLAPTPSRIATLRGALRAEQNWSYGSLITSAKWSSDSASVFYLGEESSGNRRLFTVTLSGDSKPLTPEDQNVEGFSSNGGTVVYVADRSSNTIPDIPGTPINGAATDITGLTIIDLLFRNGWGKLENAGSNLWAIRNGQISEIRDAASGLSLDMSQTSDSADPAVSPDGNAAVVMVPANEFPSAWNDYKAAEPMLQFKAQPADAGHRRHWDWPQQWALVDLDKRTAGALIDTPSGGTEGYYDRSMAVWAHDGEAVLLTNINMPIPRPSGENKDLIPCAAAVMRLSERHMDCVVYVRSSPSLMRGESPKGLILTDATFGKTNDDVSLHFRLYNSNQGQLETYHYQNEIWHLIGSPATTNITIDGDRASGSVSVFLRQDLNMPPALWAQDGADQPKLLWDPAPELSQYQLGEASVYQWKDHTGYDWIGGLFKPVGYVRGKRYPLIIQTHGFASEHEFITDGPFTTAFAARQLTAAGFLVLEVRDRHDHRVDREEVDNMVRGYESGIDKLTAQGLVDPRKVGIIGFSRTCWYVETALIHAPRRYAAASVTDGVDQSYVQAIMFDVDRSPHEGTSIYGAAPFGTGLKKWIDSAPGFHFDRVQAPVMITAITAGSILEEWELYSSLRQQHKPVDFIYIPDGDHILQNPLERIASQQGNIDWFRFWLQDYEDPDPTKTSQYKRWEQLREMKKKIGDRSAGSSDSSSTRNSRQ